PVTDQRSRTTHRVAVAAPADAWITYAPGGVTAPRASRPFHPTVRPPAATAWSSSVATRRPPRSNTATRTGPAAGSRSATPGPPRKGFGDGGPSASIAFDAGEAGTPTVASPCQRPMYVDALPPAAAK